MSTSSWTLADVGEDLQEVIDTAVEAVPGAKGLWQIGDKLLSARKLHAILDRGRDDLHDAAGLLGNEAIKLALEKANLFERLREDYTFLDLQGTSIEELLDSVKFYQISKKYCIRLDAIHWNRKAHAHRHLVRKSSNRVMIGLNPHDGSLPLVPLGHDNDNQHGNPEELGSRSERTLVLGSQGLTSIHEHDTVDDIRLDDLLQIAETQSIVGNPWAADEH